MQTQTVTKPRKPAPPPPAATTPPTDATETPARSLAEIGRLAREKAQRDALLEALERHDWNLTAVARELDVSNGSNVVREIKKLGLTAEYEKAREDGRVSRGSRAQ